MKVILTQDTPNLGALGDVVTVKDGYARNFLIHNGTAILFNSQNQKIIEEKKKKDELQVKKRKEDAQVVAQKLSGVSCTIAVKVIEDDRLFGSVSPEMVQKALEPEGIIVDKKDIHIEEPIKKLGVYQIPIKLHPEVTASCKVWVVKE